MRDVLIGPIDLAAALDGLRRLSINYDEADAPVPQHPGNWHVDNPRTHIGREPAGPPVPGGAWEVACKLVKAYEFSDPRIVRAVYRPADELLGRDLLLEGRFLALRFYLGVRVTEIVDEIRGDQQIWGWGYQTLEGHLEQGKLVYEVIKDLQSGEVGLQIRAYSRQAPIPNWIVRLGFTVFGRRMQLRFYTAVGQRLRNIVHAILDGAQPPKPALTPDGLIVAPSGVYRHPLERLTLHAHHPGR
ncbi:MAG: DUF1990 domain-containing protein [Actinomycetota bacterium]|nr:DUF1990 domain-containing protein [Actinomycetota bacterium]